MLTKQEKIEKRIQFLHSKEFGSDTYISLFTFRYNALGFLNTIPFYFDLIEKIDDNSIFKHDLKDEEIIDIKQRIILDIITKVITISEGLFILVNSLNEGYPSLSKNMIHYRSSSVWNTITNIRKNNYNIKKILAFPDTDHLSLTNKEQEFLELVYSDTSIVVSKYLKTLCNFYEKYNNVYNKTKHGMTIYPGGFSDIEPKTLENSSLIALNHKEKKEDMKGDYFEAQIHKIENRWFNVQSHLNFNKKFMNELKLTIQNLHLLSNYIISNHLVFVNNCGDSYIPFIQKTKDKATMWFYSDKLQDFHNTEIIISIQEKLFANLLGSPFNFKITQDFKNTILSTIIPKNSITNIWLQDEPLKKHDQTKTQQT